MHAFVLNQLLTPSRLTSEQSMREEAENVISLLHSFFQSPGVYQPEEDERAAESEEGTTPSTNVLRHPDQATQQEIPTKEADTEKDAETEDNSERLIQDISSGVCHITQHTTLGTTGPCYAFSPPLHRYGKSSTVNRL